MERREEDAEECASHYAAGEAAGDPAQEARKTRPLSTTYSTLRCMPEAVLAFAGRLAVVEAAMADNVHLRERLQSTEQRIATLAAQLNDVRSTSSKSLMDVAELRGALAATTTAAMPSLLHSAAWKEEAAPTLSAGPRHEQHQAAVQDDSTRAFPVVEMVPPLKCNIVRVNVGGTVFMTRRSTLCRVEGSFLESMFSGRFEEECDPDGCVFIDRNPKYFAHIINWLRDPLSPQEVSDEASFLRELDYYGLREAYVGPQSPRIYALGGDDLKGSELKAVECLHPQTRTWSICSDLPTSLALAGCAALGSRIYVTGGRTGAEVFNSVYAYDTEADTWRVKTPMKCERHGHGCAFLEGKLFVVGGSRRDIDGSISRFKSVERYDPKTNIWTSVSAMNVARSLHVVIAHHGKLFAIGGKNQMGQRLSSVEIYDVARDLWLPVASISQASMSLGSAIIRDELYVISTTLDPGTTVEKYNEKLNEWQQLPSPPITIWVPRCAVVNDRLLVFVGNDKVDPSHTTFYEFDPESYTWGIHSAPLNVPRNCFDLAVCYP